MDSLSFLWMVRMYFISSLVSSCSFLLFEQIEILCVK